MAFIVNPASAGGKTARVFLGLEAEVKRLFPQAIIHQTTAPGHAQQLARQLAQAGTERLVGVGGDGTFNEIVNGLFEDLRPINPGLTLGTLPMGTGGDLIRSLAISREPAKALEDLAENRVVTSNVGHVRLMDHHNNMIERYFINLFNFGVGGLTSMLVNQNSKAMGGKLSFLSGALKAILQFKGQQVRIKVNHEDYYQGKIRNVALANGKYCGGGMYMAPSAKLDSGQFQLVVFQDMPTIRFLLNMPSVYWGGHLKHKKIRSCFAHSLEVEAEGKGDVFVDMDGETPGKLPIKATCLGKSLRINVGPTFSADRSLAGKSV